MLKLHFGHNKFELQNPSSHLSYLGEICTSNWAEILTSLIKSFFSFFFNCHTLVPEAFFYSSLANFVTRIASYIFFIGTKRWEPRKESLWSRPLGTSLSCHQLLTVDSDWRTFLIVLWVIWLDGFNIFGDGRGVYVRSPLWLCVENLCFINRCSYQGRLRFSL